MSRTFRDRKLNFMTPLKYNNEIKIKIANFSANKDRGGRLLCGLKTTKGDASEGSLVLSYLAVVMGSRLRPLRDVK